MSFEVIETQEQLDKVIGTRIERAKEAAKAEFQSKLDELDTLTTKLEEKESKITSLSEELETAKAAKTANEAKIADLTAKVQKYEADSVKTRIARECGLSVISTHAPRVRRDGNRRDDSPPVEHFYSRASCEARLSADTCRRLDSLFLLTRLV